jgi:hypothetical protein
MLATIGAHIRCLMGFNLLSCERFCGHGGLTRSLMAVETPVALDGFFDDCIGIVRLTQRAYL